MPGVRFKPLPTRHDYNRLRLTGARWHWQMLLPLPRVLAPSSHIGCRRRWYIWLCLSGVLLIAFYRQLLAALFSLLQHGSQYEGPGQFARFDHEP